MGKKKTANSRGREAFNNGDPFDSNPHKMGELERLYWFQGWLDEWGEQRIQSIRSKLNLRNDHAKLDAKTDRA